jgi:hypothetical protein
MSMVSLQRLGVVQHPSPGPPVPTSSVDLYGNLYRSRRHARAAVQIDPRLAGHPILANERLDLRRVMTAQVKHIKWVVASVAAE